MKCLVGKPADNLIHCKIIIDTGHTSAYLWQVGAVIHIMKDSVSKNLWVHGHPRNYCFGMRHEMLRSRNDPYVGEWGMNSKIGTGPHVLPKPVTSDGDLKIFKSKDCIWSSVAELTMLCTMLQNSGLANVNSVITVCAVLGHPSCWSFCSVIWTIKLIWWLISQSNA